MATHIATECEECGHLHFVHRGFVPCPIEDCPCPFSAGDDPAYEAYLAEEDARRTRECGRLLSTPGPDPWEFTCEAPKGHEGQHYMADPLGSDTGYTYWN